MNSERHDADYRLSLDQAAEILGSTSLNVLMHIKRGLLVGEEREDGWLVDTTSVKTLIERRRGGEVPAICQSGCAKKAGNCGSCA